MATKMVRTAQQKPETQRGYPASPFRMFEDFFNDWAVRTAQNRTGDVWRPPVDVLEKDGNILLRVEVPGISEKDIDLKVEGSVLTVRGERKPEPESEGIVYHQVEGFYGNFSRSFSLPETIDAENISASYRNGILTVKVPQKPEVQPRTIKVNA
jgi:HSP20 family protein